MNTFDEIRKWAKDRNLIEGSSTQAQFCKLIEEIGEIASAISKNRLELVSDGIGDAIVVLTILACQQNILIEDCIDVAWDQIKDRKGQLHNGVFIKEEDLNG